MPTSVEDKYYENFVPPPLAPVFEPSEEEFKDPLAYIMKIKSVAEAYGVVKIKPPPSWQPPFAIDIDNFKFTPRIQKLNELEGRSRVRINFLDSIAKFWSLQGTTLKLPVVDSRAVDLYQLHKLTKDAGGFEVCCLQKKWAAIARQMKFRSSTHGAMLRNNYEKWLLPYDIYQSGLALEHANKTTNSTPANSPQKEVKEENKEEAVKPTVGRRSRMRTGDIPPPEATDTVKFSKELKRLQFYGAGPKLAGMPEFLSDSREDIKQALSHAVKPDPDSNSVSSTEVSDSSGLNTGIGKIDPDSSGFVYVDESSCSSVLSTASNESTSRKHKQQQTPGMKRMRMAASTAKLAMESVFCKICDKGDNEQLLLLCDTCDQSFHTFCLLPPLASVPKGDWRCPKCITEEVSKPPESYGFEEGFRTYSLHSFGEMADQFKADYFNMPCHLVTCEDVEREFWRLVNSQTENTAVEYGADLFTNEVGSGFPKLTDKNLLAEDEFYAKSPWNLNNLPILSNSCLSHITTEISGMKVPWVYVGMVFSTFCWHTEDHWSYSVNYLHWGEPKTWYGIPGSDAEKFENAMKEICPDLFKVQPDLLHHLVTIMNPRIMIDRGVTVHTVNQCAGEFVITFPRAYHAGFNQGYNFAEAVNFCPPDWLPFGRRCIDHYSELKRLPVFSHDELVCKIAACADTLEVSVAANAFRDMLRMVERERDLRKNLLVMGVKSATKEIFEILPDDERQCQYCRTTCFLSAIICQCSPKKLVCLSHVKNLPCSCDVSRYVLKYRYTLDDLPVLMNALKSRAESFDQWMTRVKSALSATDDKKLSLHELKILAEEAKDRHLPHCEPLEALSNTVKHADRCAQIADQLVAHKIRTRNKPNSLLNLGTKLKLSEVEAFFGQITKLACTLPQTESIREFIAKVKQFKEDVGKFLASWIAQRELNSENLCKLSDYFEQAVSFDLQLEEISVLKEELDCARWLIAVQSSFPLKSQSHGTPKTTKDSISQQSKISIEHLKQLILAGINIPANSAVEETLAMLQRYLMVAESNEEKAQMFLCSQTKVSAELLRAVLNGIQTVPIETSAVEQLKNALQLAEDWLTEYAEIKTSGAYASLLLDQSKKGKNLPVISLGAALDELQTCSAAVDNLIKRLSRLFLREPPLYCISEIMIPRIDVEKMMTGTFTPTVKSVDDLANDQIYAAFENTSTMREAIVKAEHKELQTVLNLRRTNRRKFQYLNQKQSRDQNNSSNSELLSTAGAETSDSDTEKLEQICFCHSACISTNHTLRCLLCEDYFHVDCLVQFCSSAELPMPGVFLCPRCSRSKRPSLDSIAPLEVSVRSLPVELREGVSLKRLIERTTIWQIRVQEFFKHPNVNKVSQEASLLHTSGNPAPASDTAMLSEDDWSVMERLVCEGLLIELTTPETKQLLQFYLAVSKLDKIQMRYVQLLQQCCASQKLGPRRTVSVIQHTDTPTLSAVAPTLSAVASTSTHLAAPSSERRTAKRSVATSSNTSQQQSTIIPGSHRRAKQDHDQRSDTSSTKNDDNETELHSEGDRCAAPACLKPIGDEVNWVQCDGPCEDWFHILCVGLSDADAVGRMEKYFCFKCAEDELLSAPKLSASGLKSGALFGANLKSSLPKTTFANHSSGAPKEKVC